MSGSSHKPAAGDPWVVCCHLFSDGGWRWISDAFGKDSLRWEFVQTGRAGRPARLDLLRTSWWAVRAVRRHRAALLVTHQPWLTVFCAVFCILLGVRVRHVAWSFHFEFKPSRATAGLLRRILHRVDRFVVYSRLEIDEYHAAFGIPRDHIRMIHWGIREPEVWRDSAPLIRGDYACAIGTSARDYRTLFAAMEQLPDLHLVAVLRPHNVEGLAVPANVELRMNIPLAEAQNILVHSRVMVLPLIEGSRSGHGVTVQACFMEKAFVITDVPGVRDYVDHETTALTYPPGDAEVLAAHLGRLFDDPALQRQLAGNARRFAERYCTEDSPVGQLRSYLEEQGILEEKGPAEADFQGGK